MDKTQYMKLLIVYGTTEGQTRKIAEYLRTEAEKAGVQAALCDATCAPIAPDGYDGVIIASSVHMHKYQTSVEHYIMANLGTLNDMPTAFCSVSLTAAGDDAESWKELEELTARFLIETGWKPTMIQQVAGALRFTQYDFFKKFIMRMIAKKAGEKDPSGDKEYTDWSKLNSFLAEFMKHAKNRLTLADEIL
jgi:menaquinone-dependent protoporphyrinogen oxidase